MINQWIISNTWIFPLMAFGLAGLCQYIVSLRIEDKGYPFSAAVHSVSRWIYLFLAVVLTIMWLSGSLAKEY